MTLAEKVLYVLEQKPAKTPSYEKKKIARNDAKLDSYHTKNLSAIVVNGEVVGQVGMASSKDWNWILLSTEDIGTAASEQEAIDDLLNEL